jgi:transcriptional regulator with XRE-family HTH domain
MYKYRKARGFSQEKLAELTGLHRTYISSVEREQRNISIKNIQLIAEALSIEPFKLFLPEEIECITKKE